MKKVIPFLISQAITLFGSQIVAFAIVCIFGAYKGLICITYIFCPKTIGDRSSMYEIAMRT